MTTAKNVTDKTAKLASLESQIREAKAARTKFLAAEKTAEKAVRTKQMIIVGSWLHANDLLTFNAVVDRLERDQDRAVFGLEIKPNISPDTTFTNVSSTVLETDQGVDQYAVLDRPDL